MKKRRYCARHSYKKPHKKQAGGYFFIKLNVCLGVVICVYAALSMENDLVGKGCNALSSAINYSVPTDTFKGGEFSIEQLFKESDTYAFAEEQKNAALLSPELKAEVEKRSNVYENNNKGAPQSN